MVLTPTSARTGYGSSSPATPNHGAQTADAQAEASLVGPVSLADTQESLAELENPVDDLPPRDCHRLAASRIQFSQRDRGWPQASSYSNRCRKYLPGELAIHLA